MTPRLGGVGVFQDLGGGVPMNFCAPPPKKRPVPPEAQSVRDFSPELVVEAAVRCLRAIRPALGAPLSPLLPPGISARFRLASDLAAACQVLSPQKILREPQNFGVDGDTNPDHPSARP